MEGKRNNKGEKVHTSCILFITSLRGFCCFDFQLELYFLDNHRSLDIFLLGLLFHSIDRFFELCNPQIEFPSCAFGIHFVLTELIDFLFFCTDFQFEFIELLSQPIR